MALNNTMYQLENLVVGLLEALNDKNSEVQESISSALVELGKKRTDFILTQCHQFMVKNISKLTESQSVFILNTVEKIVKEKIDSLEEQTAVSLIELSSNEMTRSKEAIVSLQTAASNLLVAIGSKYVKQVFNEMLKQFNPGTLPHLFILTTMAHLAEVNPFGVVPQLSSVLASILPMLGLAKQDPHKLALATVLCKFSEAIVYYCTNKDKAPDQSVDKGLFSTQIYAAHEILFNHWLKTSDNKLRQVTIESIGYFVQLMEVDKLEQDLNKIVPGMLALYKKHPEHYIVSQAICMIISAINEAKLFSIETLLELILKEFFVQIQASVETNNQTAMIAKNQQELLRCYTELAKRFCDKILPFLLQKLEQNNEKLRISSLTVIKHLINSAKDQMGNKRELVLSGLRPLLSDQNNKVKRFLIQTIISMAYHGYLHLEGGNLMIEFVLKQCALPDEPEKKAPPSKDVEVIDNDQLRTMADSVLMLFSTTVENMQNVLWPQLFEYVTHVDYIRASSQLCKSLAHIAEQKRSSEAPDYMINFKELINLPKSHDIFARLFVLVGIPTPFKNRGLNALQLMKNMSPVLNQSVVSLWDSVVPKLLLNLEDQLTNNKFEHRKWEDLVIKTLAKSLDEMKDERETCEIGSSFGKQITTLSNHSPEEKHFIYKCLGIIMSKTENKSFLDKHLTLMFQSVNHALQVERDGCAIGFGYAANLHLDTVLQKLETFAKNEVKKSGSLFGILGSNSKSAEPEQCKSTLVLCYGYVTLYASQELIISRLEANILRSVTGFATNVRDLTLKQNILKSLELITKCMHPDHLNKDFNFSYKANLMELITGFITSENANKLQNETKSMCYKVCSNIVKLNPKPTEADIFLLIKTIIDSYYPLLTPNADDKSQKPKKDEKEDPKAATAAKPVDPATANLLHGSPLYELTANSFDSLLNDILARDLNSEGLLNIYKHIEPWITSINDHERERAVRSVASLLKYFSTNFKLEQTEEQANFKCFGVILGRLVCRATDPVIQIRQNVCSSIEYLLNVLSVHMKLEHEEREEEKQHLKALQIIGEKLLKNDSNLLLTAVNDLSKVICKRVPNNQLVQFIEKLIEGLLDVQSHCSSSSCIVLNYCVKLRGKELENQVDSLIRHLYSKLNLIQNTQAKLGTLRTIRILFQMHLIESLNVVLTFPIPCSSDMVDICKTLNEDQQLVKDIIEHILQIWNRCLPYEEKMNVRYASITPLISTCFLTEIFSHNENEETEKIFKENFEKIFTALLVRVASTLSSQMPIPRTKEENEPVTNTKQDTANKSQTKTAVVNEYKKLEPIKISIDCFKSFIQCTKSYELNEYLDKENAWQLLSDESTIIEACAVVAKGMCLHGSSHIQSIVNNLLGYLSAPYDCQKISVTAFFAELLNNTCAFNMTELLMNNLLSKLIDPCTTVRTLCIKGLGNISSLGSEEVQKYSTTILSAMMAGLDDKDDLNDDITVESMKGLSKIIALIDENNVRPILINILLRIRPCFEKEKPAIRSSAYILFGKLSRFGYGPSKDPFTEQIHSNFVSFILHLNESDAEVKKACKYTLRQVGPLMASETINDLFQKALIDDVPLHYGEFINNLSKILISDFSEKVSFYIMNSVANFKSQWPDIRSNAVLFAGYLLGNLGKDKQSVLSKEHITNALIKLLKEDNSSIVRSKAADAISLLHDF